MDETLYERLPYASRAVDVLSAIAIHGYNVDLDRTTQARWHEAMRAMRITDSHADHSDATTRMHHMLDVLVSFDEDFPVLSAQNLGADRYSKMVRGAASVIRFGEQLRVAPSPTEYMILREQEARSTAEVMISLATDTVYWQSQFKHAFADAVNHLAIGAGMIDTANDAGRDYREGLLAFEPSFAFRLQLLHKGASELLPFSRVVLHPKVAGSLGRLAAKALKSRCILSQDI